jgi:hypothetical protein
MPDKLGRPTAMDRNVQVTRPDGRTVTVPVADVIIERTRLGAPRRAAALSAGIAMGTLFAWVARGRHAAAALAVAIAAQPDADPAELSADLLTDHDRACIEFAERLDRADGEFQVAALGRIQQAANGGLASTKTTSQVRTNAQGQVEQVDTTVTEVVGPVWQANAWLLERRWPREYGRSDELRVTGQDGEGGESPAAVLARNVREILGRQEAIEVGGGEVDPTEPGSFT